MSKKSLLNIWNLICVSVTNTCNCSISIWVLKSSRTNSPFAVYNYSLYKTIFQLHFVSYRFIKKCYILQTHANFKVYVLAMLVFFWSLIGTVSVCLLIVCRGWGGGLVLVFFVFKQPSHLTLLNSRCLFYFKFHALWGNNAWICTIEMIPLIKLATRICNFENHQPSKNIFKRMLGWLFCLRILSLRTKYVCMTCILTPFYQF